MLVLRPHNRDLYQFVSNDVQYVDRNNEYIRYTSPDDTEDYHENPVVNRYCSSKNISYALLPYYIHNILVNFMGLNYSVKPEINETKETAANTLKTWFLNHITAAEAAEAGHILVTFLYAKNKDTATDIVNRLKDKLPGSILEEVDGASDALYQKTMNDMVSRYGYGYDNIPAPYVKVWKSPVGLVVATNWSDDDQASLHFLTIGLLPVLFPQFKELFEEKELDYFKELVHRSQVKRINNSVVQDLFQIMCESCYKDLTLKLLKERLGNEIKGVRTRLARQELANATNQANQCLQNYNTQLRKIEEANKTLMYMEQTEKDVAEQITKALKAPYIVNLRYEDYNQSLYMTMRGKLKFWETDEAEMCIDRMENRNLAETQAKQFFKDVFIDKKYKLIVAQQFWISFSNLDNIDIDRWIPRNNSEDDAFFNPHLYYYGCTGNYKPELIKAARELDLMTYNSVCYTSLISMNFRDGAVWNRFKEGIISLMHDILYDSSFMPYTLPDAKCLEDSEGNLHSIKEIYKEVNATDIDIEEEDDL